MSAPRDPFTDPYCRPEDLGLALPESDHAVSVCLPTWRDVIDYEEGEDRIFDALECGYPRFVEHPYVAELFLAAGEEFARDDEAALVFPSLASAWRCAEFARNQGARSARLESYGWNDLTALLVKEEDYPLAWKGWQHMGEIVSSRMAEAALTDSPLPGELVAAGEEADRVLRSRIADLYEGVSSSDVLLFSSGMGAISAIHRVAMKIRPDRPTMQIEFPYLDSSALQRKCNPAGYVDLSVTREGGLEQVRDYFSDGRELAAAFTEVPSNPLLRSANVPGISRFLAEKGTPFIIDDTVATALNVDVMPHADAVTTSLTKAFSGAGDVAGGAVIVNPDSPFHDEMRENLVSEEGASPLFCRDALVLESNSRHFGERVEGMTSNAGELAGLLREHPGVEKIWYPAFHNEGFYDEVRTSHGGYGALMSIRLHGDEATAARFYDALQMSKGPSLGTNFSIACPYTLLAHYTELAWAAECGVPRDLIRIWAGLEEPDDLLQRVEEALEQASG